jgi:hypothetical protein
MQATQGRIGRITWTVVLLASLLVFPGYGQDDDIFGIERKLKSRTRKSESELGNVFRNVIGSIAFELGTGTGFHANTLNFGSQEPKEYPITSVITESITDIGSEDTLMFRGGNFTFPFHAGVRLNLFDLLEVGGGYGREWGSMNAIRVEDYRFNFDNDRFMFDRLYGTVGLVLYDAGKRRSFLTYRYRKYSGANHYMQSERRLRMQQGYPWRFLLDGEFGRLFLRESFDHRLESTQPYYSIGLRIEREFSEYTKMFVRPGITVREFGYNPGLESLETQTLRQQIFTVQAGVAVRLPATKRCKVSGCGVVMKHMHNGVEYRGSSIWHMQNRKVGQW